MVPARRLTRHDYEQAGGWPRILEAAICWADADSENDREYHAAKCRVRSAVNARVTLLVDRKLRLLFRFCDVKKLAGHYKPKAPAKDPRQVDMFGGGQ